jgi:hypothetical protein
MAIPNPHTCLGNASVEAMAAQKSNSPDWMRAHAHCAEAWAYLAAVQLEYPSVTDREQWPDPDDAHHWSPPSDIPPRF